MRKVVSGCMLATEIAWSKAPVLLSCTFLPVKLLALHQKRGPRFPYLPSKDSLEAVMECSCGPWITAQKLCIKLIFQPRKKQVTSFIFLPKAGQNLQTIQVRLNDTKALFWFLAGLISFPRLMEGLHE